MNVTGTTSPADLTRVLLGAAVAQQVDMAKKIAVANTEQVVRAQSQAGLGELIDAVA